MKRLFWFAGALLLALAAGRSNECGAADETYAYKVKAAFLLNFAKFTTWPASCWSADNPYMLLAIVGSNPFGAALQGVEKQQIGGRAVRLRHFQAMTDETCQSQMLFVSKSEQANVEGIVKTIGKKPVVTVSDIEGFADAGGMLEFKDKDGRLSFVVNNSKAKENGVHISSSLLNLALEVH